MSILGKVAEFDRTGVRRELPGRSQSVRVENVLALLALVVSLVGLPAFLIAAIGNPLPSRLPSPTTVWTSLQLGEIPSRFVIGLLAILLWGAWLQAAVSFVAHMLAVHQFREAPRPRNTSSKIHRLVGRWIASATIVFLVLSARGTSTSAFVPTFNASSLDEKLGEGWEGAPSTALNATGSSGLSPLGKTSFRWDLDDLTQLATRHNAASNVTTDVNFVVRSQASPVREPSRTNATARTYVVQPKDTLWDIAEQFYGDGSRSPEIAAANPGIDPLVLPIGVTLQIPGERAVGREGKTTPINPSAAFQFDAGYVVQPHDSLWKIAEEQTGDGANWTMLAEANRGRVQPDGRSLEDPDLIHPGWDLLIPASDAGVAVPTTPAPSAPPSLEPTKPAPTALASSTPAPFVPPSLEPSKPAPTIAPPPALPKPTIAPPPTFVSSPLRNDVPRSTSTGASETPVSEDDATERSVPLAPALLCVAASSTVFALERSRRRLLATRPQGRLHVPPSKKLRQCEQLLRAHMNPELLRSIDDVNRLLTATWDLGSANRVRYLSAATLSSAQSEVKKSRKAASLPSVDPDVHVHLEKHAVEPSGFAPSGERTWKRAVDAPEFGAVQPRPFFRGLTCIGSTDGQRTAWIDLIGQGGLIVSGPFALDVTLQAVLQLVGAPWLQSSTELIVWAPDSHDLPDRLVVARTTAELQACLSKPTKFAAERIIFSLGDVAEEVEGLFQNRLLPTVVVGPQRLRGGAEWGSVADSGDRPHLATFNDGSGLLTWPESDRTGTERSESLALSRVATSRGDLMQTLNLLVAVESPQTIPNEWAAGSVQHTRRTSIDGVGDGLIGSSIRDFDDPDLGLRVDLALGAGSAQVRILRGQPHAVVNGRTVETSEDVELLALLVCSGGRLDVHEVETHLRLGGNHSEATNAFGRVATVAEAVSALGVIAERPLATIDNVVLNGGVTRMVVAGDEVTSDWSAFFQIIQLVGPTANATPGDRLRTLLEALLLIEGSPATATEPSTWSWFEGLGFRNEILATVADVASEAIAIAQSLDKDSVALRIADLATRANPYDREVYRAQHQLLLKRDDHDSAAAIQNQYRTTLFTLDLDVS